MWQTFDFHEWHCRQASPPVSPVRRQLHRLMVYFYAFYCRKFTTQILIQFRTHQTFQSSDLSHERAHSAKVSTLTSEFRAAFDSCGVERWRENTGRKLFSLLSHQSSGSLYVESERKLTDLLTKLGNQLVSGRNPRSDISLLLL